MKKDIIRPALTLFIICLISSLLLAVTNEVTKDKIAENAAKDAAETRMVVMSGAASFSDESEILLDSGKAVTYCSALDGSGNIIGYVFTSSNKGYGGDVKVMTAIDPNGTIIRIAVLELDDETPGLGQNAAKADFTDRFIGKSGMLSWVKNTAESDSDIVGVTSASFSSKAVIASVNDATSAFVMITSGEGGDAQ